MSPLAVETSAANNDTPEYPSAGPTCETCKKPDMSNMSAEDGVKYLFNTFFAAPRMWPVGYILANPYSPLRLEREMPSQNWRDAFEDLLALESGGEMIKAENRKAEDQAAACERFRHTSWVISCTNRISIKKSKEQALLQEHYEIAARHEDTSAMDTIRNKLLPALKSDHEGFIDLAQRTKDEYEKERDLTASQGKPRGQWIASLMNSGALPTWTWGLSNSTDGPVMDFRTRNTAPESYGTVSLSEQELSEIFEEERPFSFSPTVPLPQAPIDALVNGTHRIESHPWEDFTPSKAVVAQSADTEPTKLPDGSSGWKTNVCNTLADGTSVTKAFAEKPGELYEEIVNARASMDHLRSLVRSMLNVSRIPMRHHWVELVAQDETDTVSVQGD